MVHVYMLNFGICYKKRPFSYSCCFWHLDALSACFKSGPGGASGRMESSTNSTGKGHQLIEIGWLKGRQFLIQHQ